MIWGDAPILLLAWRRPDAVAQVLAAIRAARPSRLFVACDGPRAHHPEDAELVRRCREVIDHGIDWPCTVERLYRDANAGCRHGVSEAITWFFEHVEEGIVLEDDCVPHPDFFAYCAELLARYSDDERIWCIGGMNVQDGNWRGDASYYFSRYNHVWGWASWRRAWSRYDVTMASWPAFRDAGGATRIFEDSVEARFWSAIWEQMWLGTGPDTWDYQWTFACLSHGALTALPNRNLVRNIGFGADATNTHDPSHYGSQQVQGILPLTHARGVHRDQAADTYTFARHFHGDEYRRETSRWQWQLSRLQSAARDPAHFLRAAWRRIVR